ncbi:hypothetical protein TNCV_2076611 [Trichonephila clavipes]|nr:hypothetical protein TNCV_2076611 [Trichonephila clavipes]
MEGLHWYNGSNPRLKNPGYVLVTMTTRLCGHTLLELVILLSAKSLRYQASQPNREKDRRVWKVLRRFLLYYPNKISRLCELKYTDCDKRLTFALSFLARMEVDDGFPCKFYGRDEAYVYLGNTKFTEFEHWNRQCKKLPCIQQKSPFSAA